MEAVLTSLNAAQRDAVLSDAAVLQVLAPPGSGKTKTLTARVGHLVASGLRPWNIIVCTFTVKAAREMQGRIKDLVDDAGNIKIGTFHGIALRYLRKYKALAGLSNAFGVADTSDSTAILRRIIKLQGATIDAAAARSRISSLKAKGIDCVTFAQQDGKRPEQSSLVRLYQEYQAELKRGGYLDYDDILLRCVDLLTAHPDCVKDIEAVLVDEFQDTNSVQYELMSLFAQRQQKITIVGDPDQSIYGWRSAEIRNLHRMKQHWPDTITIHLEENYRSSGSILVAAQAVIEQDKSRPPKSLQATLSYGHKPVLRRLPTARDEAIWIVEEIRRIQSLSGGSLNHNDFAVLLRTASLSRIIETSLGTHGIPYRMVGGTEFFDRVEVKIVLDYLRVIDQPAHNEALARVLNVPPRRIGDKTLENLQTEAQQKGVTLWSLVQGLACGRVSASVTIPQMACKGLEQFTNVILTCRKRLQENNASIVDLINVITQKTNLQSYLRGKYAEDYESRWAGIEDLMAQATEQQQQQQQLDTSQASEDTLLVTDAASVLTDFLANAALAASIDADKDVEAKPMVTISTMHAAKGLEWPVVFVPACFNGSMPHSRSEDHDEERRLLYVAMTRAQVMLYLSCPLKDHQKQETSLSIFVSHPSCAKLFEELGPAINVVDVRGITTVLRRPRPTIEDIRNSSAELIRDLDDYWPADGSAPVQTHEQQWQPNGSNLICPGQGSGDTHLQTGFATVKSQFTSLQEQELKTRKAHGQAVLKGKAAMIPAAKSASGRGQISSFFAPRSAGLVPLTTMQQVDTNRTDTFTRPLTDITRIVQYNTIAGTPVERPTHSLRSEPLKKRQRTGMSTCDTVTSYNPYIMFSSSPIAKGDKEAAEASEATSAAPTASTEFKTASTTHVTSYQSASIGRKTLGVKRSMNGWAQRGKRPLG